MTIEDVVLNGSKVGVIHDGLVYVSNRKQSKHLYRGGKTSAESAKSCGSAAWGVTCDLIPVLLDKGVIVIAIRDSEIKKTYWVSIKKFEAEGKILQFGHGLQKFLNLNSWGTVKSPTLLVEGVKGALKMGMKV